MQTPKYKAVLYLDRNRIDLFTSGGTNVFSCNIPPTALKDLDIKNKDELDATISQFISQNKLPPASFITILSHNIVFEKDIVGIPESQTNDIASEFIDAVPFENTISKIIRLPNGYRVIVTNKDYYDAVCQAFEQHGFISDAAVAAHNLGQEFTLSVSLDLNAAKYILQKFDLLKTQSILPSIDEQKRIQAVDETNSTQSQPEKKSTLPLLLAVFGILILILLILFFTQILSKPKPPPSVSVPKQIIVPTLTPTASPSASPAVSPSSLPTATKSGLIQGAPQP